MLRINTKHLIVSSWERAIAEREGFDDGYSDLPCDTSKIKIRMKLEYRKGYNKGKSFYKLLTGNEIYTEVK